MNDFGGIAGKRDSAFPVFLRNEMENLGQFREGLLGRCHERVAAGNRGDFGHPAIRVIAIEHNFVIFETHLL